MCIRDRLEVVSALLAEKYKIETAVKEPTVIYLERTGDPGER